MKINDSPCPAVLTAAAAFHLPPVKTVCLGLLSPEFRKAAFFIIFPLPSFPKAVWEAGRIAIRLPYAKPPSPKHQCWAEGGSFLLAPGLGTQRHGNTEALSRLLHSDRVLVVAHPEHLPGLAGPQPQVHPWLGNCSGLS